MPPATQAFVHSIVYPALLSMVQLYVFNPGPKLRLLSTLLFRGTRRILGSFPGRHYPQFPQQQRPSKRCAPLFRPPQAAVLSPKNELTRDPGYYAESHSGFCAFRVENTLFNVHQVLLAREPSAFGDMLRLPQPAHSMQGTDEAPVFLTDTVQQFRHFLWALYAPPNDLFLETDMDRLLDIATLANKYCFSSLEAWAIEHIYSITRNPSSSPFNSPSKDIPGRILDVAILCNHRQLQNFVTHHLISQILWCDYSPDLVLPVAEKHGLRTLLGVCYYRQLVNFEADSDGQESQDARSTRMEFPPITDIERRMRFLSAHHSLLGLWERIRSIPPALSSVGCASHMECEHAWQLMWFHVAEVDEKLRQGSADILGRMKGMMLSLRKTMADAPGMPIECKMTALEAITQVRDEVIEGLVAHFMKPL